MNRAVHLPRIALALALLLGAAEARADDWTSLGLDATRSRLSAERSGPLFGPTGWESALPPTRDAIYRALLGSPALADGFLIVGTETNVVRGLRADDGQLLWEFPTRDAIDSSPAVWRGWAFVAGLDHQLYAIRIADGGLVWKRDLGGIAYASPTVVDGSVYVTTDDPAPRLYRFDAESGKLLWRAGEGIFEQAAHAPVAIAEGHVVVAEVRGRLHSFAVADGAREWTAITDSDANQSPPIVINGRIYLLPGGADEHLYAFELGTGAPVKGWPVALAAAASSEKGNLLGRTYVVSSLAGRPGQLLFDRRVEDRLDDNGDGTTDVTALDERVMAVDTDDGHLLWSSANGTLSTRNPNRVPSRALCPTPALYKGAGGETLAAVASTLAPRLRVLDASSGDERWSAELSGATRGSPVLANGRLVVGTDAGVLHSFLSRTNAPPTAPGPTLSPAGGQSVDAAAVTLRWGPSGDREGDVQGYEVRLDDDGELLHDWDFGASTAAGRLSLALDVPLAPGRRYTFAVRARDSRGAWSPWSLPAQFQAVAAPAVEVDGKPAPSLAAALAMARAGSVIGLGAGTFPLSDTLRLPAGASLVGTAPHLTTLDGKGLAVAVQAGAGNKISQLTVTGAATGVEVGSGDDARLQNVVLRDNREAGLSVTAGAGAQLINATVARNGSGVRAAGKTEIRNAIITANEVGVDAVEAGTVSSKFNDVFANRTLDFRGASRGASDRADPVTFGKDDQELRLTTAQATTDSGDPADDFANEPEPNGGRINLGAFGNTRFAELSDPSLPPPPPPPPGAAAKPVHEKSGACSFSDGRGHPDGTLLLVALALLLRRRRR